MFKYHRTLILPIFHGLMVCFFIFFVFEFLPVYTLLQLLLGAESNLIILFILHFLIHIYTVNKWYQTFVLNFEEPHQG